MNKIPKTDRKIRKGMVKQQTNPFYKRFTNTGNRISRFRGRRQSLLLDLLLANDPCVSGWVGTHCGPGNNRPISRMRPCPREPWFLSQSKIQEGNHVPTLILPKIQTNLTYIPISVVGEQPLWYLIGKRPLLKTAQNTFCLYEWLLLSMKSLLFSRVVSNSGEIYSWTNRIKIF